MSNLMENYGLDFMFSTEEATAKTMAYLIQEGKPIMNYYGTPYLYKSVGHPEFFLQTHKMDDGNLEADGLAVHCAGNNFFELVHTGIDITPRDASPLSKIVVFRNAIGKGAMLPLEVITADVLPSLMEGDRIKVQVVAHPLKIAYYADEDEYAADQPELKNGKKLLQSNGTLIPWQFLSNHSPKTYDKDKDYESDRFVYFNAVVKELYYGTVKVGPIEHDTFIRCFADTEYGTLSFNHTLDQVPEKYRKNIKPGTIISGVCVLSGDAAIFDYENGLIKDHEHDLMALRYSLVNGEAERLKSILTADAIYVSDSYQEPQTGSGRIVEKINSVYKNTHDNPAEKYYAYLATITETPDPEYPVDTRCIVLAQGTEDHFVYIMFITVNENGLISRIRVSKDTRFRFQVDPPEKEPQLPDDIEYPESLAEAMVSRAKFYGLIGEDVDPEHILDDIPDYWMIENNANGMLDALKENPKFDNCEVHENVFGYLFAKIMECMINHEYHEQENSAGDIASYSPSEAFSGEIASSLSEEQHEKLKQAMEMGKQFHTDFMMYISLKTLDDEESDQEAFIKALIIVQRLGQLSKEHYFGS